jgi:hypothetical protein
MPCVLATGETVPRAGTKLTMVRPNACGSPRRTMIAFKRQPSRCAKGGSGPQNRRNLYAETVTSIDCPALSSKADPSTRPPPAHSASRRRSL